LFSDKIKLILVNLFINKNNHIFSLNFNVKIKIIIYIKIMLFYYLGTTKIFIVLKYTTKFANSNTISVIKFNL